MRKWHRWISLPAFVFLVFIAVTGLILQVQGIVSGDDEPKETAPLSSMVSVNDLSSSVNLESARAALATNSGNIRLRKIEIDFRSSPPTLNFYTAEPSAKQIQMEAGSYKIISEKDVENDFWMKLHSGEILGDVGRAVGIFGGLALLFLSLTGSWVYYQMYSRRTADQPLHKRFFW